MKYFLVILVTITITETPSSGILSSRSKNTNSYLNAKQTIRKYGYPSEAHIVQTADGYLLEMHRIPHGKSGIMSSGGRRPPIFYLHGLVGSSDDLVLRGSPDALAFLLADLGFDVWLGNARGNKYSIGHVSLFPDDKKFWNFTWHESAIYDAPAQIDFICNYTKQEKIIYIGYSMGTTIFFVMTSTLPEYNKKIELSLLMAATAYVENIKSPLLRYLLPFSKGIKVFFDLTQSGSLLPGSKLLKVFGKIYCEMTRIEKKLCMNAVFLISGNNPEEFDENLLSSLLDDYPSGYSIKGVNHYSQLVKSGKFRQYDYGKCGNMQQYGSPTPPDYNLSLITTPIYMYQGKNDYLADLKDANRLAKELKSLRRMKVVDHPKFTHFDFLISLHVKKLVYDILINDLMSHLNGDNEIQ